MNGVLVMPMQEEPAVDTSNGPITGRRDTLMTLGQKVVDNFWGIPYALPPVGPLRFKKPVPAANWTTVRQAKREAKSCPQDNRKIPGFERWTVDEIDEDCLYLNVFLPKKLQEVQTSDLPVLVWLHGGGFYMGSSTLDLYDGRYLAASSSTIVVSLNYRLGALGFLNLEGDTNVGLLDQVEALKWVRNNIKQFGGNPNKVTLFGESAGAVSVGLHLLSDVSKNKFHRAILQSGSPLNPWAVSSFQESRTRSLQLAERVGCSQKGVRKQLKCLRDVPVEKILKNQWVVEGFLQFPFIPTVDNKFLNDTPENLLSKGAFEAKPLMAGSNKDESTFFLFFAIPELIKTMNFSDAMYQPVLGGLYKNYPRFPATFPLASIMAVLKQYPATGNPYKNFETLNQATTDSAFICPMNRFLQEYAKHSEDKIFSYFFTQTLSKSLVPFPLGSTHGLELFFTFGNVLKYGKHGNFTNDDSALSTEIHKMWSSFANNT